MKSPRRIIIITMLAGGIVTGSLILRMEKQRPASGHGHHEDHQDHEADETHATHDEHEQNGTHEGHDEHHAQHNAADHIELTAAQLKLAGVEIAEALSAKLRLSLILYGKISPNQDRLAHVSPRYPGIVLETRKRLGDPVEKDEVIAVIESNESLRPYDLRSLINGTVIAKNITVGEFVTESEKIYSIADLSTVWVDLNVYRRDFDKLREGQKLQIDAGEGVGKIEGSISYLSPFGAEHTQSLLARSVVQNPDGLLRPGVFVIGRVILGEPEVNVAVRQGAVQMLEEEKVVFVEEGDAFEARPVRLGRHDDEWVEVLDGLQPGERYAAKNSYIFKAELGKASAEHSH